MRTWQSVWSGSSRRALQGHQWRFKKQADLRADEGRNPGPATKTAFVGAPICRDCLTNCWQSIRSLKTAPIFRTLLQTSQGRWNRIPHVSVPVELPLPFFSAPLADTAPPHPEGLMVRADCVVSKCACVRARMWDREGEGKRKKGSRHWEFEDFFFSFQLPYLWKKDIK